MRRLSENLYALLKNGQMRLYSDPELERELLRLEARQTGYGWRIDHRSGGYSDRAMAIGMAALHAALAGRELPLQPILSENDMEILDPDNYEDTLTKVW